MSANRNFADAGEFKGVPHWHYHEGYCFRVGRREASNGGAMQRTATQRQWFWSISVRKRFDYRSVFFDSGVAAIAHAQAWIEALKETEHEQRMA